MDVDDMGKILFYGERGIVNGIVLDIKESIEKQKAFLRVIRFPNGVILPWIDNIISMDFVVEPSFSEFGNPDLIMIAQEENKNRHVLFVEAKVSCYDDAAIKIPALFKNNASRINVQLALKFRFVQAYKKYPNNEYIEEDEYVAEGFNEIPRRIKNREMIKMCNENFKNAVDYSFIALTNDKCSAKPFDNLSYLPPIGDKWENNRHRFGLLSYEMLEKANIVKRQSGYYGNAASAFLGLPADIDNKEPIYDLKTINIENWSAGQKAAAKNLMDTIISQTGSAFIEKNGSYSFCVSRITLVKVFTHKDSSVILALRNDNLPEDYKDYLNLQGLSYWNREK